MKGAREVKVKSPIHLQDHYLSNKVDMAFSLLYTGRAVWGHLVENVISALLGRIQHWWLETQLKGVSGFDHMGNIKILN